MMPSTMIYTTCHWQVDAHQLPCIWRLNEALQPSGGVLRIIPQVMWYERRLLVDTFVLKTSSRDTIEMVKTLCQGKLILENWRDASELDFEHETAFNPFSIPAYDRSTWEARVHMATEHNLRVQGKPIPVRQKPVTDKPLCGDMWLSVRVFNSLPRTGNTSIGDVMDLLQQGPDAMLAIQKFGEKSLDELIEKLQTKGFYPPESPET